MFALSPATPKPPETRPAQDDTFTSSDPAVFRAASGDLAVSTNVRTAGGWLFPLPGALLFLGKPAQFIRHSEVAGCEFARVGATSSTFDLEVRLTGLGQSGGKGARVEFGQMDRGDLPRLQAYVAERRLPVRADRARGRGFRWGLGDEGGGGCGGGEGLTHGALRAAASRQLSRVLFQRFLARGVPPLLGLARLRASSQCGGLPWPQGPNPYKTPRLPNTGGPARPQCGPAGRRQRQGAARGGCGGGRGRCWRRRRQRG